MIQVKCFPLSSARRDKKGLISMPNGSNFYEGWYQLMGAHKTPYIKKSASTNLDDMLRCSVWFMSFYRNEGTSDEEYQRYADMYELSLVQFLAKERILKERGRKYNEIFPTLLNVVLEISTLYEITKKVLENNSIDWLTIESNLICIKA